MKYLILLFLFISGCNTLKVDPSFQEYLNRFQNNPVRKITVVDLIMKFGTVSKELNGECQHYGFGETPTITIDKTKFESFNDAEKEELIFHELGHCVLQREHTTKILPQNSNFPGSIMYFESFNINIYIKYHDYYVQELFNES